jgi:hypothetical protein
MSQNNFEQYFRAQQVSLQWLPVLRSLAMELERNASPEDLRDLFFKTGEKFSEAIGTRCENVSTLTQFQDTINEFWSQINWGWVEFTEANAVVEIHHQAAPLAEAFGDASLAWSVGLLEGFYESIFKILGASDEMHVTANLDESTAMCVRLDLGR